MKYNVTLMKSIAIVIEADTEDEARKQAVAELEDFSDGHIEWEVSDLQEHDE